MSASLFEVVEVDPSARIRCQAPGCHKSVYKRIHVVRDANRIVAVGSDCWARIYAHSPVAERTPRFGTSEGRLLTAEERELLATNTAAFVAYMEAKAASADALRAAAEARAAENHRHALQLDTERRLEQQRLAALNAPWVAPETKPTLQHGTTKEPNALERYRAQQAASAARAAIAHLPALRRFSLAEVEQTMVDAKADYLARGLKLDAPGSRQVIEARAFELLERAPS